MQTEVASGAERTALAAPMPHLASCLAAGVSLRFSEPVLRGIVAEALYDLSVSAQPVRPAR